MKPGKRPCSDERVTFHQKCWRFCFQYFLSSPDTTFPNTTMKIFKWMFLVMVTITISHAAPPKRAYYEIKIYEFTSPDQEKLIDDYLKNAYIPALHRAGINKIGVFKPVEKDTAYYGKRIYVLTPFTSLD